MPDVGLFIRTSGERTSNFLLWQSACAEMVFVDALWPGFDHRRHLWQACETYASRDRRYEAVPKPTTPIESV